MTLNHNLSKIALSRQFYDDDLENLEEFQKEKMKEFEETPFESDPSPQISVKSMLDGLSQVDKTTIERKVEEIEKLNVYNHKALLAEEFSDILQ